MATWVSPAGKRRDLMFVAYRPSSEAADAWLVIASGTYEAVTDAAAHWRAKQRGEVKTLTIALPMDEDPPQGLPEKQLMRLSRPWY